MKVLVTGCNGQVGHSLTTQLTGRVDVELLALDKDMLDITDKKSVDVCVSEFRPNIIINTAAYTSVDNAEDNVELSYSINRDGPRNLAEAAKKENAVIIHLSTDYVFDGTKALPYNETDKSNPIGVYGQSKHEGELAVAKACTKHFIIRTAWVFGEHGTNFVKTMLRIGQEKKELKIVADQFGGPTFSGDLASVIVQISLAVINDKNVKYGIYHYSGLPHVSWFEFASVIFENANKKNVIQHQVKLEPIDSEAFPTKAFRPCNSKLDLNKIINEFNVEASDWRKAIINIDKFKGSL